MPDLSEWIPVELEIVDRIWKPDTEILKLKGFNALEVLGKLQVRHYQSHTYQVTVAVWTQKKFFPLLIRPQGSQWCQKITFFFHK